MDLFRKDFPLLHAQKELIYLDSAATTQKPASVIDAISRFYQEQYGTVHRGVYDLSIEATRLYSEVREKVKRFIGAKSTEEIIFTRGTTAGINLIARSLARGFLQKGDEILLSVAEHHSNLLPWQMIAEEMGVILKFIPITDEGALDMEALTHLLNGNVKVVSLPHIFNVLGTINPIKEIASLAHKMGALLVVDGAQGAPHLPLNVQDLDADFYLFSGHKLYGPTGVGVLFGKYSLLERMPPIEGGGDMISQVTLKHSTYAAPPLRFEAGTPMIAEVIGLGAAIDYLEAICMEKIAAWENTLLQHALAHFQNIQGIKILGTALPKSGIVSFTIDKVHPLDLATLLNCKGVAIRSGHLCSQPTMQRFGITSCARISFALYNTLSDIDQFFKKLNITLSLLS